MVPLARNAAGRVNSPPATATPQTSSMTPPIHNWEPNSGVYAVRTPNTFWTP